jgi:hypothetical protein
MKNQKQHLALFQSLTGKTQIDPPVITDDISKHMQYYPVRIDTIRKWNK